MFGEAAIAGDAEQLAAEAEGFVAAPAEFAFTAEDVGLDGHKVAGFPVLDGGAKGNDASGDFAAEGAGELDGDGQAAFLGPEVEAVQAAGLDLDEGFVRGGHGVGEITEFKGAGAALGNELDCSHGGIEHLVRGGGKTPRQGDPRGWR